MTFLPLMLPPAFVARLGWLVSWCRRVAPPAREAVMHSLLLPAALLARERGMTTSLLSIYLRYPPVGKPPLPAPAHPAPAMPAAVRPGTLRVLRSRGRRSRNTIT